MSHKNVAEQIIEIFGAMDLVGLWTLIVLTAALLIRKLHK